jgi:hypothetical protein
MINLVAMSCADTVGVQESPHMWDTIVRRRCDIQMGIANYKFIIGAQISIWVRCFPQKRRDSGSTHNKTSGDSHAPHRPSRIRRASSRLISVSRSRGRPTAAACLRTADHDHRIQPLSPAAERVSARPSYGAPCGTIHRFIDSSIH